jgi:hypothetical protein
MNRRELARWLGASPLLLSEFVSTTEENRPSASRPRQSPATIWPPLETLVAQLHQWRREHPRSVQLGVLGKSVQGRPIYAVSLTDSSVDATDKEQVLITALHSGIERSGATTAFHLLKWLLSGDRLACEVLKRQVITCLPLVNPDGYVSGSPANGHGKDPYTAWTLQGPSDAKATPEAAAVQQIMDRLQPEVHADIHGLDLSFPGYIMAESSAAAWSNAALRPYHHEIVDRMNEAALVEGYPSVRPEEDAERLPWGPDLASATEKLWYGRGRPYAALYAYAHYHSLILATEVCWERSGVLRHRRLLELGNQRWPGEYYPGYPGRVIAGTEFHRIVAYGRTAEERRRSRVELWNKLPQLRIGFANPQVQGLLVCVASTSPAVEKWLSNVSLHDFAKRIHAYPQVNVEAVRQILAGHPEGAGQWGTQAQIYLEGSGEPRGHESALQHGFALHLRIPFAKAQLADLRLNGKPLVSSDVDGFRAWRAEGFTHVQVNIPPQAAGTQDFFLVTGRYETGEQRARGWPSSVV